LVAAHLVERYDDGRYGFHDLIRVYAVEVSTVERAADRALALRRLLHHQVLSAEAAARAGGYAVDIHRVAIEPMPEVRPVPIADAGSARRWYASERRSVVAAVVWAAGAGMDNYAWRLTEAMSPLSNNGLWRDLETMAGHGIAAAGRLGNRSAEVASRLMRGRCLRRLGERDRALAEFDRCVPMAADTGDWEIVAAAHQQRGVMFAEAGDWDASLAEAWETVRLAREHDLRPTVEATGFNAIAWSLAQLGRYAEALPYCDRALELFGRADRRPGLARTWDTIGYIRLSSGDRPGAVDAYSRAVDLSRQSVASEAEADALASLGDVYDASGDDAEARRAWRAALALYERMDAAEAVDVRARLRRLVSR
jgi:tetratricopeptide (TPR) repeat protein